MTFTATSTPRRAAAIVAVGVGLASLVAQGFGAGPKDTALVIGLAALASVGAAVAGALAAHAARRRRLRTQVLVIGLAATMTTGAGVFLAGWRMFIAEHDVAVLACVLLVSSSVAVGAGLRLGAAFEADIEHVRDLARTLVDPVDTDTDTDESVASAATGAVTTEELRTLRDELHFVAAALDQSRDREQALDAARRELVAWVSHDLRSPIASLRAMAEALEDAVVDDQESVNRYHRLIRLETERLSTLVDDLFELSRIAAGALSPDEPLSAFKDLVVDAIESVEAAAAARGIDIRPDIDGTDHVLVPAAHLRRALHNVLENAIRHTPVGGTLRVHARTAAGCLAIDVDDECGGIPTDDLHRVFDVAFRGDVARVRDSAGGGLGLAIARGLLELHAGTIDVGNLGGGCRFTLRLPIPT